MSFQIPPELRAKLSPDMNLKQVQQYTTIPPYDSNSQILNKLSPTNLINTVKTVPAAFGFDDSNTLSPRLPAPQTLNNIIKTVASTVDYETPIRGLVDNLLNKKIIPNFSNNQSSPSSLYNNTFQQLNRNAANEYNSAKNQISNIANSNQTISNTGTLQNAINSSVPAELSAKKTRDLASSPSAINEFVAKSKDQALQNVAGFAATQAQNFLKSLLGGSPGSGMIQPAGSPGAPYASTSKDYRASVSVSTYSKSEKLGSKNAKMSSGASKENKYLIEGISCASNLPIGTKIVFDSPQLGTRIVMEGGGSAVQQEISQSQSTSLGNIAGFSLPYTGNFGLAKTDQKVRSGGSGSKLTGKLFLKDLDGKVLGKYDFVNGGAGRGSIPFGRYVVSNYMTATQRVKKNRSQAGALRGKDTFDLNDVYDPVFGADRTGLLIHQAANATEGCIGIQGNWSDFVQKMKFLMAKNGGKYNIELGPDANTVNNRNSSGANAKIYFESEKMKKQFEKKFRGSFQATIQLPKSGKYEKDVITPYGGVVKTVAAYYPKNYGILKTSSVNKLSLKT